MTLNIEKFKSDINTINKIVNQIEDKGNMDAEKEQMISVIRDYINKCNIKIEDLEYIEYMKNIKNARKNK
jgi:hypothetical protein